MVAQSPEAVEKLELSFWWGNGARPFVCGPEQTFRSNRRLKATGRSIKVQSNTFFLTSGVAARCTPPPRYEKEYILGREWLQ